MLELPKQQKLDSAMWVCSGIYYVCSSTERILCLSHCRRFVIESEVTHTSLGTWAQYNYIILKMSSMAPYNGGLCVSLSYREKEIVIYRSSILVRPPQQLNYKQHPRLFTCPVGSCRIVKGMNPVQCTSRGGRRLQHSLKFVIIHKTLIY